jgi:hypothetical protein
MDGQYIYGICCEEPLLHLDLRRTSEKGFCCSLSNLKLPNARLGSIPTYSVHPLGINFQSFYNLYSGWHHSLIVIRLDEGLPDHFQTDNSVDVVLITTISSLDQGCLDPPNLCI